MALTTIKIFLTDDEKEKFNNIVNDLNNKEDVVSGETDKWTKKDVYELLLGKAIKNYHIS
jgi:hypothetical protein